MSQTAKAQNIKFQRVKGGASAAAATDIQSVILDVWLKLRGECAGSLPDPLQLVSTLTWGEAGDLAAAKHCWLASRVSAASGKGAGFELNRAFLPAGTGSEAASAALQGLEDIGEGFRFREVTDVAGKKWNMLEFPLSRDLKSGVSDVLMVPSPA